MRILLLNNNAEGKGTFWRCFGFAKYLVIAGHSVTLMCLQDKKCFKISKKIKDGVEIILLPCNFNFGIRGLPEHLVRTCIILFDVLLKKYNIIHAFNVPFLTCGLSVYFFWVFKKTRIKRFQLIVDWDDLWGIGGLTDWKKLGYLVINTANYLETKIPLLGDKVTVVSDELRQRAINIGVKTQNIFKIINGADTEAVKPINMYEARTVVGLDKTEKIICFAANVRLSLSYIVSSFEKVAEKVRNARLILLINRVDDEIKEMISMSKVKDKISFIGFQPYERYLQYLAASDIVLLPRSSHLIDKCEFPGRLGDLMALGKPVVTNNNGDIWKIIEDNKCGLVAKVGDTTDFASKVVQILNNPKLAKKLARNGRKAAVEKYSWGKITNLLIKEVYK